MPRNGKQKERLTKREIRRLRRIISDNECSYDMAEDCSEGESLPGYCDYDGGTLPSELFVSQNRFTHHIRAFVHFNPDVRFIDIGNVRLAFMEKTDRDNYDAWYDDYIKKFGEAPNMAMPPPTDGVYPHLEAASNSSKPRIASTNSLSSSKGSSGSSSNYSEYDNWLWIMENCEDEVRYAGNNFYFASSSDAALYRLTRI